MIGGKSLENQFLANNDPQLWIRVMTNIMTIEGLTYSNPKTLAKFTQKQQMLVTGLNSVSLSGANGLNYPDSEHFLIFGIQAFDGAAAAIGSTNWQPGISDAIAKNGQMTVTNNGTKVLKDYEIRNFLPSTGNADVSESYIVLDKPILLRAQTTLDITLNFSTVVATANYNIDMDLFGYKFI